MKFRNLFLVVLLFFISASSVLATQLPQQVKDYVLKEDSKATIRFDGLITLSDGSVYIPVFPAYPQKVDELQVTYLYPKNVPFSKKPEVIVFNDNFSLLKLVRTSGGILTVSQDPNIPVSVKTGAIPQDILVPKGLVLPESLKGILGNVEIPVLNSSVVNKKPTPAVSKTAPLPNKKGEVKHRTSVPSMLTNKIYFVTNFDSQYLKVFNSGISEPMYGLKLNGVPKNMKPFANGRFLLIITTSQKQVDVVDVRYEYIAKQIELGVYPDEIVVDNKLNRAYVSSISDQSIFVIDLNEMKIKEKIQIIGAPIRLTLSEDSSQLGYIDRSTSNIYIMKLDNEYENKLVANQSNIVKMIIDKNKLYTIDRTNQKLIAVDFDLNIDFEELAEQAKIKPQKEERELISSSLFKRKNKDEESSEKNVNIEQPLYEPVVNTSTEEKSTENKKDVVWNNFKSGFKVAGLLPKDLNEGPNYYATSTKEYQIGPKPNDMILYNGKLFILCSQENQIYTFNTVSQSMLDTIKLPMAGFSKKITRVDGTNLALVTNVLDKKYVVVDLDTRLNIQTLDINMPVNEIIVVDKP